MLIYIFIYLYIHIYNTYHGGKGGEEGSQSSVILGLSTHPLADVVVRPALHNADEEIRL
jgi:hypothetical protein